jgi:branched-chain amino acid transport system substrate-binding protein
VVFTALKTRKKNQTLKDTVLSLKKFQGLQNDFSFDAFGDVERLNASINIVQNQKFIVVD